MKDYYSTGEAARLCNVSIQTIIRCFDSGKLHGFRIPGGRFRRIPHAELMRFAGEYGIPTAAKPHEQSPPPDASAGDAGG